MVSEHASPLAVLGGADAGGQNVFVASLARALAEAGVEVTVHTRRDDPDLPRRVELCPGVVVEHVDAGPARVLPKDELLPFMEEFGRRLRQAWARRRPDIVHAHFWMSGLAATAAARPLDLPLVQTFHALGVVKRRHQGRKDTSPAERLELERRLMADADAILATSTDELFELVREGADHRRVRIIPAGVDLDLFCPSGPAWERPEDRLHVVVLSRLVERKGVGNVISALGRLPQVRLTVAGGPPEGALDDDPEVRRYRRLAERLGVQDQVRLVGSVERAQVPALLRSADVVACVPWYEPFGMVALEAMACGVPVVASAAGGLVDTVIDEVTGLHVPPRRPQRLAEALKRLQRDPELRRRLGDNGADRVRQRFGWARVAAATVEAYDEVLAGRETAEGLRLRR
jgi:glycosyltransferase involved in cell wall biosynthesis